MVDIQFVAAEIRRGKKRKKIEDRKKETTGQNIMAPLLHRAAIIMVTISLGIDTFTANILVGNLASLTKYLRPSLPHCGKIDILGILFTFG